MSRTTQNCKQLFMYMNNWDKGVAPDPDHVMDTLINGLENLQTSFEFHTLEIPHKLLAPNGKSCSLLLFPIQ